MNSDDDKPQIIKVENPKITIELFEDGQLQVTGAIQNKIMALGMLECAKLALNSGVEAEPGGPRPGIFPLPARLPRGFNPRG